jgi:hypothetical protein
VNWDAIGAVGEALGAIAVLVTLMYLATQIRQTNRISLFNSSKELIGAYDEINRLVATDSSVRDVLLKQEPLSENEEKQLYAISIMYGNVWVAAETALRNGQIQENLYRVIAGDVTSQLDQWPAIRAPLNLWLDRSPELEESHDILRPIRGNA